MDKYIKLERLGEGASGWVRKAIDRKTQKTVAIKEVATYEAEDEIRCLNDLDHPNIIKLLEVHNNHRSLYIQKIDYLILECMDADLQNLMRRNSFSETKICELCLQIFKALAYMHGRGYCHRDLKPSNLLVSRNIIKIGDFGLACNLRESEQPLDWNVVTRWYRAPELLFRSSYYEFAIDMWAMGAVMAELFTGTPLFRGDNDLDQIDKICAVIGSPNHQTWPEGLRFADELLYQFPVEFQGVDSASNLGKLIPRASHAAIDLIHSLCSWDPRHRLTAEQALGHPFFNKGSMR